MIIQTNFGVREAWVYPIEPSDKYRTQQDSSEKSIRNYVDFYLACGWESHMNSPFSKLLFICETKAQLIYTKRHASTEIKDRELEGLTINFSIAADVYKHGFTGNVWEKVM